ncbi:MAG: hypothetical protein JWO98_152, partial [Frankiales bacterium]|nr:hypothetical protein [Frankiales bacterium]
PAQRDLTGTLEVGLAGLHRDDVGQGHTKLEEERTAQVT